VHKSKSYFLLALQSLLILCFCGVSITYDQMLYHKDLHPRCVYNKLDWSVCTCLTQLYGGRDMYNSCLLSFSFINLKMANEKGRNM